MHLAVKKPERNAGLTYMMGLLAVIVGFLIVHYHNLWAKDWTVLITIYRLAGPY